MNVHVLQHVAFEGLGSIDRWMEERGAQTRYTRFFENDPLPVLDSVDMLIALGGPMSVNDEANLPWLRLEKQFVREAVARDIPVLGVCLGAQLIASALGSRVFRNPLKEIGWFPVQAVSASEPAFRFPPECLVFHWHGETFDLPDGAVRLVKSAGCENQAFQLKHNVVGLQFHLEMNAESALVLVENCRDELIPGPYVQSELELRAMPASSYEAVNGLMSEVLTYLTRPRAERKRSTASGPVEG
jgi:GMP synthase-like glutamine amidotransferase